MELSIQPLTKAFAQAHLETFVALAQQIPKTNYSAETVLAESKGERKFYGKWQRSLVLLDGDKIAGFIMGYERATEKNEQYPESTIYMSELALWPEYRGHGLGKKLITAFLEHNQKLGMQVFSNPVNFSVQTNSAPFNQKVRALYRSFGFKPRATKQYPQSLDVVMGWTPT
jgi:ribosomal protein S18 acetylase RimI-like enzyme